MSHSDDGLTDDDARARLRRTVYALLIVASAAVMTGRICAVGSLDKLALEKFRVGQHLKRERAKLQKEGLDTEAITAKLDELRPRVEVRYRYNRPFLSSNDRSRWCTIRALVEHGTYEIDAVVAEQNWDTIDMVKHVGDDGRPHLYSSKPTLLPTLLAGEYWVIHRLTGRTLGTDPFLIGRVMLVTINVAGLAIMFFLLSRIAERYGTTDGGRLFVVVAAVFGTLLTTFAIVVNNHLIGAVSSLVALYASLRIWYDGQRQMRYFVVAGLAAAFTAANELPALSFFAMLSAGLLWRAPRQTLIAYVPAAAVVVAAFFGTQYVAHDSLRPAYMHRHPGEKLASIDASLKDDLAQATVSDALRTALRESDVEVSAEATVRAETRLSHTADDDAGNQGWVIEDDALQYVVMTDGDALNVHAWDNWYDFTYRRHPKDKLRQSYWSRISARSAIDRGEADAGKYALHVLVGHHGIFLLTPMWLLSVAGVVLLWRGEAKLRALAVLISVTSVVCLVFYLARPAEDRNYGGGTSGFRWMLWFAPMWLVAMLPAADRLLRSRRGACLGLVLLGLSIFSASYPIWNPWRHPWVWNLMEHAGLPVP